MCLRFLVVSLALSCLWPGPAQAQDRYGAVPDSISSSFAADPLDVLRPDPETAAVVRLDRRRLVVHDAETSTLYVHRVVTVYSDAGRRHGRLRLPYHSFVDIEDLDGRLLDANGEEMTDLGDEHLQDRSGTRLGLYDDYRERVAYLVHDRYPYTVEYRYELRYASALHWPRWFPEGSALPVELRQFVLDLPPTVQIRLRSHGSVPEPVTTTRDGRTVVRWRVTNRAQYQPEPYGPTWRDQAASLEIAPTQFVTAGIPGDMTTWDSFGRWAAQLRRGRDILPPDAAQRMQQLVAEATTRRDSVRQIYRHLQETTRYVSVQLGIGGWQPFPAAYVEERGYGDCKALTNYMKAALAAVGIPSFSVLIYRGSRPPPIDRDFPGNPFNHEILAVPLAADTLWLENTSQTAPFDHVAADIEDRYGLWIGTDGDADGGMLVHLPRSTAPDNRQHRTATVRLSADGTGQATVRTLYTGNQQDRIRRSLAHASPRERRAWLRSRIGVPSFDLVAADFTSVGGHRDTVSLPLTLALPRYATATGSRLFVPLNPMSRWTTVPEAMETPRSQPIHFASYPFLDADSIRYELPAGFALEAGPGPVRLETDFATYEATVDPSGSTLIYRRRLAWRQATIPADRYPAFRSFLRQVARADAAQVVLVKSP